jgi:ribokinase
MNPPTVLVVGSLHYDIVVESDTLPRRDETAVGRRWYPKFGGKGGNQAVSVARQGARVRFLGAIGDDDFGRFLAQGLDSAGVDARFLRRVSGMGSGMSVALQDAGGDYAATIVSGANMAIDPAWLVEDAPWDAVGLLVLQNEVPEAVNVAAAAQARQRGIPVVLNAAPYRALLAPFARLVDVLVVNAVEAEMMGAGPVSSLASASEAARSLVQHVGCVIVTAGAHGLAVAKDDGTSVCIEAEKVDIVSSHGAGDAFVGACVAALLAGEDIEAASRAGSQAAARHVAGHRRF